MDLMSSLSFGIGVLGIVIALVQGFEKKKLTQHLQSQAWYIYSLALISSSTTQTALRTYKESHKDKIDSVVFEQLSKSDAYNVSIFLESIRQIHLSEPKFNLETIGAWMMQGKITKEHATFFIRMTTMDAPNLLCLLWQSWTLKIKQKLIKSIPPSTSQQNTQKDSKIEQPVVKS